MLSLFPSLLSYQFAAITLIRVAAALALLYMSYHFFAVRGEIVKRSDFPIVYRIPEWFALTGVVFVFIVGVLMLIGLYTQAVAIVGMLLSLKHVIFARRYPGIMALSAGAGALLFVMCLALLFMGAGAFAFDLPL